ncbi:T9SS type A sorting domain-containing protein [Flavobacterium sp.]|uniref:DUF7619 domain-containing protein n=1 Tax=Flavobacterium sp. TaxID=239 RepID=UPI00286C3161|nr:T9SS type A sorting domain-containing protein [Flavobacterium sp.]
MKNIFFLLIGLFLFCSSNAQILNIPDARFKLNLINASASNAIAKNALGTNVAIDTNADGEVQVSEALIINELSITYGNILNLNGIEGFANLHKLSCTSSTVTTINASGLANLETLGCSNTDLSTLNVAGLTHLKTLSCANNNLVSLDLTNLTSLETLYCPQNQITSLDCSGLSLVDHIYCSSNQLTSLNLTGCSHLSYLDMQTNDISNLDVSDCTALYQLTCNDNQIGSLDLSQNHLLWILTAYNNMLTDVNLSGCHEVSDIEVQNNLLTTLDASDCYSLTTINFSSNHLQSLGIKNGSYEFTINPANNPNLNYVCCDENQANGVKNVMDVYGYPNCTINTYCTFTPGGDYFTLQGNAHWDADNNGCNAEDMGYPNLKLSITNGTVNQNFIANQTGAYGTAFVAGSYTITPVLENPSYFNITPASVNIAFPNVSNPAIRDFCITSIGLHSDVRVTLLPLNPSRPGFDANYMIVYENIGNQAQSGTVSLNYIDLIMDLVESNPAVDSTALNTLYWNFSDLQPFEKRMISVKLNINSPVETPPVIAGDFLGYFAYITIDGSDEHLANNRSELKQLVVNSVDPNDKTCIQGNTISPSEVGKYVDYIIRFENSGTANAENIVVKDIIDVAKFDVSSLILTNASHSCVANISATNKVEFIFENINLPFDDQNNDGYVAFKIKTKPTLVVGDTFTNNASIYFDYNAAIVTNNATTTIQVLAAQDFEFTDYFKMYPNPASTILNIESKKEIRITSIAVYNILGQLLIAVPNAQEVSAIDVSNLKTGNYFIKINSDKGTTNTKFIKN